ncbi:MAG: hypothetical protein HC780_23595 [Leptolyngbyaceae cyanobacterium CSU_1_3]|nr:hypothetical protein [Leptolyngbyaceae cyanobacterium CSU_1_3]
MGTYDLSHLGTLGTCPWSSWYARQAIGTSARDFTQGADEKQDKYIPSKYKYTYRFSDLPMNYTHVEVVVKFGWQGNPAVANNFVLTAYLVEKG